MSSNEVQVGEIPVKWDKEKGTTDWGGAPAFAIWLESSMAGLFLGFQRMVGTERFILALHGGGRDSTDGDWALISSKPTFEEGFAALAMVAASAAWGRWELISVDRVAHIAQVRIHSSWESVVQRAIQAPWGSAYVAENLPGYFNVFLE